ncbi:uncharacterized protein MONBRDRAFT_32844 [Monosiga brevicollis MX1]|uniref:Uncharacterized protein n=1 Tax=Monosiga brevicollis TaxID=81824 RepID=A9V217_MONBE|nr:uncharacterized protein MONBRDRAFT_32844 [Monosiga brevicollis MX1]EDQ88665.1 predicted protein [Monosiga brevicollis MX1]|eukprot:XP_001746769.1 hypothetical protein [Monosiga brevicollis MX1]
MALAIISIDLTQEKVVIQNNSDAPYNLKDHYAENLLGTVRSARFDTIIIPVQGTVSLYTAPGSTQPPPEGPDVLYFFNYDDLQPRANHLLRDAGDGLRLLDPDHDIVCEIISGDSATMDLLSDNIHDPEVLPRTLELAATCHVPENLAELNNMSISTLMNALHRRYAEQRIYTYVGDILIAVNPYERLPIYTHHLQEQYKDAATKDLPPHIFAVADRAYNAMVLNKRDQTFVISGESGAGKTESTKLVVKHIVELCRSGNTTLENKIKMVNPFLEAFGNAKTVMNDNSSRFGKYLELKFDETGGVLGGEMLHYLLEKSRVVTRNAGEHNFHIFYNLFAGAQLEGRNDHFAFSSPNSHRYLAGGPSDDEILHGHRYTTEWREVIESMHYVGFASADMNCVWDLLAAILHLGDVTFADIGNDASKITSSDDILKRVARLLAINETNLRKALLHVVQHTRGETIIKNFTDEKAVDNRDSMAKAIYTRIFDWVFRVVNELLDEEHASGAHTLGMLDIFGFENFKVNSLEQLCINVTNEQLQNYFNRHIFIMEQDEYNAEGIDCSRIDFPDNQPTLDLMLQKGTGVFGICDEQANFPKATDLTFTQKCTAGLSNHASQSYKAPRSERDLKFTISHYAGPVDYTTEGFLEKNRDKISEDVKQLLHNSSHSLLAAMFEEDPSRAPVPGTMRKQPTVLMGFKRSLQDLVKRLDACEPHFIRCIKPNATQKPANWDAELVERQLTYAGVLETIKIRKRFKLVKYQFYEEPEESPQTCHEIAESAQLDNFQLGSNKIFMKYHHAEVLSKEASKQSDALIFVQKIVKGFIARQQYVAQVEAKRRQDALVTSLLGSIDASSFPVATRMQQLAQEDARKLAERREFLERLRQDQARRAEEEARRAAALSMAQARRAQEEPRKRTKPTNGYMIWQQNEHFELSVGPLPPQWRKALDPTTERFYFKDYQTQTTTWIDPRSGHQEHGRKRNPLDCNDSELPFGWDEGETEDGKQFWINHLDGSHHDEHPRIKMQEQQTRLDDAEARNVLMTQHIVNEIHVLREKQSRQKAKISTATDKQTRESLQQQLASISASILQLQRRLTGAKAAMRILARSFAGSQTMMALTPEQAVKKYAKRWKRLASRSTSPLQPAISLQTLTLPGSRLNRF